MTQVKTFKATVKCDRDWVYENAFVAVRQWSESSQNTGSTEDFKGVYDVDSAVEAIAYRGNFWQSVQDQVDGKRSKPLVNLDSDGDSDLFKVDLEHLQSIQVMNSSMAPLDKMFRLIELDVIRRFA